MVPTHIPRTAKKLLIQLGIRPGHTIIDFGCGTGLYTIQAAKIVGSTGIIIAVDESKDTLNIIKELAKQNNLNNIDINLSKDNSLNLSEEIQVDIILAFDVLHYLNKASRVSLYRKFHQSLSSTGRFIIHPKHTKNNSPMWHLSTVSIQQLIDEITQSSFQLVSKQNVSLIHDEQIEQGPILIFEKEK
jgi:cyclopropane fatty-acyl-phospholipid synthase-like methyltransferase